MARKTARPGRTLVVFFLGRGARLRPGGPRRHLEARARPRPAGRHPDHPDRQGQARRRTNLNEAASIIDQRVNGSGVTEAEVTTQGNKFDRRRDPRQEPPRPGRDRRSARRSCASASSPAPRSRRPAAASRPAPSDQLPGAGRPRPDARRAARPATKPAASPARRRRPRRRTGPRCSARSPRRRRRPARARRPARRRPARVGQSLVDARRPRPTPPTGGPLVDQPLKWMTNPDPASVKAFNAFPCPTNGAAADRRRQPRQAAGHLRHRRRAGVKYLLSPAVIEGTDLNERQRPASRSSRSAGWSTSPSTARAPTSSRRSLAGAGQHRQAVRDRARRPGASRRRLERR